MPLTRFDTLLIITGTRWWTTEIFYPATVPYHQAWWTREALRRDIEGLEEESFQKLPALCEAMRAGEDGTYCEMATCVSRFFRFFVAPGSSRHGWLICRPFFAVDGTFLKGPYRMTLSAAVTLDGNNEILLLAWGLAPGECQELWSWFLAHLGHAFPSMSSPGDVMISDRDKTRRSWGTNFFSCAALSLLPALGRQRSGPVQTNAAKLLSSGDRQPPVGERGRGTRRRRPRAECPSASLRVQISQQAPSPPAQPPLPPLSNRSSRLPSPARSTAKMSAVRFPRLRRPRRFRAVRCRGTWPVATAVASSADSSDAAGGDGGQTRRRTMSAVRLSSFANDMIMMFAS